MHPLTNKECPETRKESHADLPAAPVRDKVYFLSDLHLGAGYRDDRIESERRVSKFLLEDCRDASDIYLMGDILDYWFEYRTVVPRGYIRFFGALAALADAGVRIHWYIGNHDIWLFDYLRTEIGIEVVDGYRVETIKGKRFFLNHGDGVGRLGASFSFIRRLFRNKVCQKLYSAIHPRWTIPFANAWSRHSRKTGGQGAPPETFQGVDKEPLGIFAQEYLRDVDPEIDYFVFGHRHVVADVPIGAHSRLVMLGDWLNKYTYAVFDGEALEIRSYTD